MYIRQVSEFLTIFGQWALPLGWVGQTRSIRDGVRRGFLAPSSLRGQILGIWGRDGLLLWNPARVALQELGLACSIPRTGRARASSIPVFHGFEDTCRSINIHISKHGSSKKVENKKEEKAYVRLGKLQSLLMCWQRGAALRQKGETARGGGTITISQTSNFIIKLMLLHFISCKGP